MKEKSGRNSRGEGGQGNYRLRLAYSKTGLIRFISHRDLIRIFFRAFSRSGLPVVYSRGYSPHPRVSFCPPLKVGMEGLGELLDLLLAGTGAGEEASESLNRHLPEGIVIRNVRPVLASEPSLNSILGKAEYRVVLPEPTRVPAAALDEFMAAAEVRVSRLRGGQEDIINARRGVLKLVREEEGILRMILSLRDPGRPYAVLAALSGEDISLIPGLRWQRLGFLP